MKRFFVVLVFLCMLTCACTAEGGTGQGNVTDLYLPSDPDIGRWEAVIENEDIIAVDWAWYPDIHELGLIGTAGAEWFRIRGLTEGTTTLKFLFINSFTLRTNLTLVYRLNVDERLNVMIWGFEMLEPEYEPRGEIMRLFFTWGGYEKPVSVCFRKDEAGTLWTETEGNGETAVPETFSERLTDIVTEYNINGWNGFQGNNADMLDGEEFHLTIIYENEFVIEASGNNEFPENYQEFKKALMELFSE